MVSKNKSNNLSTNSGSNSSSSNSPSDPNDPSNFAKNSAFHQSFYGMAYTPANSQIPNCGNSLGKYHFFLLCVLTVVNVLSLCLLQLLLLRIYRYVSLYFLDWACVRDLLLMVILEHVAIDLGGLLIFGGCCRYHIN